MNPTIRSEGNCFVAPNDSFKKQVSFPNRPTYILNNSCIFSPANPTYCHNEQFRLSALRDIFFLQTLQREVFPRAIYVTGSKPKVGGYF